MDYDQTNMPENYDLGRQPPEGVLDMWLDRIAAALEHRRITSIIDLGCGTGRFTERLAKRFDADVIGVDPSEKMLAQAKAKPVSPRVKFVRGSGEDIPCAEASADLVFASMAFHHFESSDRAARECLRVLRPTGAVCIRNSLRELGSPYEAYFPNYAATLSKLPTAEEIIAPFARNGFRLSKREAVAHKMADSAEALAEKASFRADTTLQLLADEDFARGLKNMREARNAAGEPVMIDLALFVFAKERQ